MSLSCSSPSKKWCAAARLRTCRCVGSAISTRYCVCTQEGVSRIRNRRANTVSHGGAMLYPISRINVHSAYQKRYDPARNGIQHGQMNYMKQFTKQQPHKRNWQDCAPMNAILCIFLSLYEITCQGNILYNRKNQTFLFLFRASLHITFTMFCFSFFRLSFSGIVFNVPSGNWQRQCTGQR